jgi:hypothetical protein
MSTQTWNSEGYSENARFVTDLGTPVLELLAPSPGWTWVAAVAC